MKNLFTTHNSQLTKFAFTLAETLIVMGVIGVVAALTLPNLNSSTGDKEKVVKVKKIYQNLEDALGRATAIYGPVEQWADSAGNYVSDKRLGERIVEFMKITKSCYNSTGCFAPNDDAGGLDSTNGAKYILADGTSILFEGNTNGYGYITVDIDGPNKGSARIAKDIFQFYISQGSQRGQLFPWGGDDDTKDTTGTECPKEKNYICTAWVIENGNMDYLKTDSQGKCNNSNITLSDTITSCK